MSTFDDGLASRRRRLRTRAAIQTEVTRILADTGAAGWVHATVEDTVTVEHRQQGRGRPGPNTTYKRTEHHHYRVTYRIDPDAVAADAASDGCFPFITNLAASPAELLAIYKTQPRLERRHATFKGVLQAAPLTLKSETRIDALGFCLYVALLVHALVERDLRQAMADKNIPHLPLYHEQRPCAAPTAARVFELLEPLHTTTVLHRDHPLITCDPTLDTLQRQLLSLLNTPLSAYQTPPRPSP